MTGEREQPLFRIFTTAVLLEWMSMDFLHHSCLQRMAAVTMGYSSWNADEGERDSVPKDLNSEGQAEGNHLPRLKPPKPMDHCTVECLLVE